MSTVYPKKIAKGSLLVNPNYQGGEDEIYARPVVDIKRINNLYWVYVQSFTSDDPNDLISYNLNRLFKNSGYFFVGGAVPSKTRITKEKHAFSISANWHGQVFELETRASTMPQAIQFAYSQIAERVGVTKSFVHTHYKAHPNGLTIAPL